MQPTPRLPDSARLFGPLLLLPLTLLAADPTSAPDAPDTTTTAAPDPTEEVLQLETFQVNTTVGSYAETTASSTSKLAIDMKDMASTFQVLNANFIGDKLASTLEDLYPYVVGMTRESPAGAGFTLRGYTNSATNTMINNLTTDGLPGGASRFGSPTTANVDRVEVLKGPNSVLYGAMNPGGLINIVTKQPSMKRANTLYTSVGVYAGNQGDNGAGFTTTFDSTGPLGDGKHWLYRFIASYEDAPAWRQFDWARNYYFFPSLTYRLNENTEATLKLEFHRERRFAISDQALVAPGNLVANVPADHSIVYQDPQNESYDWGDVYSLVFKHKFANKWEATFNTRTVHHGDGRRLLENRTVTTRTPIEDSTITQRLRDTWNRRRYSYYDLNLTGAVGPDSFKHTLLFGLSGGYETHNFTRWIFQNVTGPAINVYNPVHGRTTYPTANAITGTGPSQIGISKYYNYSAYVSDQIKLGSRWQASIGLRTEKYDTKYWDHAVLLSTGAYINPGQSNHPESTVPSFGLVYQPTDTLSLYASYAQSFKPTPPNSVAQRAPQPDPETADQTEVGLKADFLDRKVGVLLSLYQINRADVVEPVPNVFDPATGIQVYRSLSNESKGVELSVNLQPKPHFQVQIGYSFNDASVTRTAAATLLGAQLANAPRQSGNVWMRYNVPDGRLRGFGVGLGIVHTGARNAVVDNRPGNMLTIPANTRGDLSFYYTTKRYELALNFNNLTDVSYIAGGDAETNLTPGAPRKITVSMKKKF